LKFLWRIIFHSKCYFSWLQRFWEFLFSFFSTHREAQWYLENLNSDGSFIEGLWPMMSLGLRSMRIEIFSLQSRVFLRQSPVQKRQSQNISLFLILASVCSKLFRLDSLNLCLSSLFKVSIKPYSTFAGDIPKFLYW